MIIDPKVIPVSGVKLVGEEQPEIMDLVDPAIRFPRPIRYEINASLTGGMLLLRGRLETRVLLKCSRCLEEFERDLTVESFFSRKEVEAGEGKIDLTEDLREDIILTLPLKPLCTSECRGLCPICGRNLNRDKCDCAPAGEDSPFAGLDGEIYKKG